MRWVGARQSTNVEDRRFGGRNLALGGGVGTIVLIVISLLLGVDPNALLQEVGTPQMQTDGGPVRHPNEGTTQLDDVPARFVATVLADTEDTWHVLFREMGKEYVEPKLVLFRDEVSSACGFAQAAIGPFYCPSDSSVYLDLSFFDSLERRFQAPGDFAQAYVIAHEIGHHVQNLLGISDEVHSMRRALSEKEANALSVRMELQADYFAGVWAHHANKARANLEEGDIAEALRAASAIGDDTLQRRSRGYVVPDSFTHGTSEQRVRWFMKGFRSGDVNAGDTFTAEQ